MNTAQVIPLAILLLSTSWGHSGVSEFGPTPEVCTLTENMVNQSDLIVVGYLQGPTLFDFIDLGQPREYLDVPFQVSTVLKGDAKDKITVRFSRPKNAADEKKSGRLEKPEERVIYLLTQIKDEANIYSLIDAMESRLTLSIGKAQPAVKAPLNLGNDPIDRVRSVLLEALNPTNHGDYDSLLSSLQSLRVDPTVLKPKIKALAKSTQIGTYAALSYLVEAGDSESMEQVYQKLTEPHDEGQADLLSPGYRNVLTRALVKGAEDSKDRWLLMKKYLNSPSNNLKRMAAQALRVAHDPKAVPLLGQALKDPDPEVQMQAMMGLKRLLVTPDNLRAPGPDIFFSDPVTYIQPWIEWWRKNQNKVEYRR